MRLLLFIFASSILTANSAHAEENYPTQTNTSCSTATAEGTVDKKTKYCACHMSCGGPYNATITSFPPYEIGSGAVCPGWFTPPSITYNSSGQKCETTCSVSDGSYYCEGLARQLAKAQNPCASGCAEKSRNERSVVNDRYSCTVTYDVQCDPDGSSTGSDTYTETETQTDTSTDYYWE
jgi:hypothetical protein